MWQAPIPFMLCPAPLTSDIFLRSCYLTPLPSCAFALVSPLLPSGGSSWLSLGLPVPCMLYTGSLLPWDKVCKALLVGGELGLASDGLVSPLSVPFFCKAPVIFMLFWNSCPFLALLQALGFWLGCEPGYCACNGHAIELCSQGPWWCGPTSVSPLGKATYVFSQSPGPIQEFLS